VNNNVIWLIIGLIWSKVFWISFCYPSNGLSDPLLCIPGPVAQLVDSFLRGDDPVVIEFTHQAGYYEGWLSADQGIDLH